MGIGSLLPDYIKDPLRGIIKRHALPVVLHYAGVDPLDYAYRRMGIGNYETDEISGEKFLVECLLPKLVDLDKPVLFDVGANVGHYSKALHAAFPKADIAAFEPVMSRVFLKDFYELLQGFAFYPAACQRAASSEQLYFSQ